MDQKCANKGFDGFRGSVLGLGMRKRPITRAEVAEEREREVASLRERHAHWNEFFRALFVFVSAALGVGRAIMLFYAWR